MHEPHWSSNKIIPASTVLYLFSLYGMNMVFPPACQLPLIILLIVKWFSARGRGYVTYRAQLKKLILLTRSGP